MSSQRRILASRRNGLLGGPKTDHGRGVIRYNAVKHGLTATTGVLPYEDQSAFDELRAGLYNDWLPSGEKEVFQFEEMVSAAWKLLRVRRVETEMFSEYIAGMKRTEDAGTEPSPADDKVLAGVLVTVPSQDLNNYFRYERVIERSYYRAVQQLERQQTARRRREQELAAITMNIPEPPPAAETA